MGGASLFAVDDINVSLYPLYPIHCLLRFVYAASEHDFVSMLQSFEEMGVKLSRFDPAEVII